MMIVLRKSDLTEYAVHIGMWDELAEGLDPSVETIEFQVSLVKAVE